MTTIYLALTSPKGNFKPFSWLIRWYQRTPYSHVATVFSKQYLEADNDMIFEAAAGSVRIINDRFFYPHVKIHRLYCIDIEQRAVDMAYRRAMHYMGSDYSVLENLGLAFGKTFGLKTNPLGYGDIRHKCSETAFYILQALGFDFSQNAMNPDLIDVKDIDKILSNLCETHPNVKRIDPALLK